MLNYLLAQSTRRTDAKTAEQVAAAFKYHAVERGRSTVSAVRPEALRQSREKSPNQAGVVRALAQSDPGRWVSPPTCRRLSSNVTSTFHRNP